MTRRGDILVARADNSTEAADFQREKKLHPELPNLLSIQMGHYCRICGRHQPNEKFSGKGHRIHVCKECARLPRQEREAIELQDELYGFLNQSHISPKNRKRLALLSQSPDPEISDMAQLILKIAEVKPYKRRRLKFLREKHPVLLRRSKKWD